MGDNSWYEKGELPEIGAEAEFFDGSCWNKCKINAYSRLYVIIEHDGKESPFLKVSVNFRPIKTERELAIEAALKVFNIGPEADKLLFNMAGALFDAGLLRSKNES